MKNLIGLMLLTLALSACETADIVVIKGQGGSVGQDTSQDTSADTPPADDVEGGLPASKVISVNIPPSTAADKDDAPASVAMNAKTRFGLDTGGRNEEVPSEVAWSLDLHTKAVRIFSTVFTYTPNINQLAPYYYKDNLKNLKTKIDSFYAQGFRVTVTFSGEHCSSAAPWTCPAMPKQLAARHADGTPKTEFDAYLVQIMTDLGPSFERISAIEVWNEWDNDYGYRDASGRAHAYTPEDYVNKILHGAYLTIKEHNKKIQVITGSVVTNNEGYGGASRNKLQAIVDAGAGKYADAFGYHPYVHSIAELDKRLSAAEKSVAATGKPLVLTEWGCLDCDVNKLAVIIDGAFDVIGDHDVDEADYYLLNDSHANPSVLVDLNGKPIATVYNAFKNALADFLAGR